MAAVHHFFTSISADGDDASSKRGWGGNLEQGAREFTSQRVAGPTFVFVFVFVFIFVFVFVFAFLSISISIYQYFRTANVVVKLY